MSSSGENFDLDGVSASGSESEDYAPAPKKATKAAPRSKAAPKSAKAPAKSKAAPKKKVLVDNNEKEDSDEDGDDGDANEAGHSAPAPANGKKKTASETYTKLSQLEHILKRPDSYIGSVETITQPMWTWDSERKLMVHGDIKYVPGFFKIVDEILVNAADNKINDASMDTIKVTIDAENNLISVYNNGRGIPIEIHSKEKIYIPELIFGHLLSSSNYDDDEKKLTGGRNGYGAKLANIYSTEFTVETADKNSSQKYSQTWTENMSKMGKAKITKNGRGEEYTRVTFRPDLKRFGMDSIDADTVALLKKRVHDLAGTVKDVKVFLNDERLKIKNFKQYVELYLTSAAEQAAGASGGAAQTKQTVIYEKIGPRWEVAFALSEGSFQQVSFANSISTIKGGTHVMYIADQIAKHLITSITKKNKAATVKPAAVKNHIWIFVNALIENPTFDSQTKETLTLPASKFGTKPTLSEDFLKKVGKSPLVDHVLNWARFKADQQMKKTDGNRRNRLTGLPKLSDANNAGTKKAADCTLILTEGDSAKSLAVAGLSIVGRDNYGVFPLRGKLLNVRDAKHEQIMKNEEIQSLKKIMGLQHNKEYNNVSSLRYGRLMLMTDQDHDGSHIKGLLINYLDHFYPSLLKLPEFLVEFVTPIVRVKKGNQKIDFYTIPEFEKFMEETPDSHKWTPKYYKGLGTSTDEDGRAYFREMRKHMIPFSTTKEGDRELIELAFSKKRADDRKEWLRQFKPGTYLDHTASRIAYSDFINRELILFSMADNIRSIPSVADGLKPVQRKVIWSCFRRKLASEIKVAQLVGYVSEHSEYHHGEASLMATIINLAQDFVGGNNLNLLMPNGQFGTRDQGGKDHAAARYIFTEPAPVTRTIYHPADDPLLKYNEDDGKTVEPEWYLPVVPMVLINGADGIGTGWSTSIPAYNPEEIVANIRRLMNGEEQVPMMPWWRGFTGTIKKMGEHKYDVCGVATKLDDTTIEITELPIHKWTQNYKAELEAMCGEKGDGVVKDYKEYHNNMNVHFVVTMNAEDVKKAEAQGLLEFFKLTTKINTSNMMCFDFDGKIKKYASPEEIVEEFYPKRLAYYQKRKDYLANELQTQLERLNNQARFVKMIVEGELTVSRRKKLDIVAELRKKGFRRSKQLDGFDYLLGMAIHSLTYEKIEKLLQQAKGKEAELLTLLELTPNQIWQTDLDRFLEEWRGTCDRWNGKVTSAEPATTKKGKRKQATLKALLGPTKKKGDDDSDDDFKPTKAGAKKKAPESKAKPAAVALDDDDDASPPAKRKPVKKPTAKAEPESDVELVDDDDPVPPPPRKRVTAKQESDSDLEVIPAPKDKGKGKAVATAKRKSLTIEEEDGTDDELELRPAKKRNTDTSQASVTDFFDKMPAAAKKPVARKPSSKAAPAKKAPAKVVEIDDEDATLDDEPPAPRTKQTARKTSGTAAKGKAPAKKAPPKIVDSDDDVELMEDVVIAPPVRTEAPRRAARGGTKKYVEVLSDSEAPVGDDAGSDFEDY
ncbi:type II DNA topoisomerase [Amylocystis lapponica]|nr:type II DNA topoisomerase [Amylocystis lapponica]